jgi:uncharacterized protein (TIGR02246 family)
LKQILIILTFIFALGGAGFGQTGAARDERKIRELIGKWDTAYRGLDAKRIASLETPDFELVDRFGGYLPLGSREENERMWSWTFKNIYQGRPGPAHTIDRIRFINSKTAIVTCRAFWADPIKLPDGTIIPPHGQTTTFTAVKTKDEWQIAAQTIHNKMEETDPGNIPRDKLPWNQ